MPCCFLKLVRGIFRGLKESLRKISEGINPSKCLKNVPPKLKSVCHGLWRLQWWWRQHHAVRTLDRTDLREGIQNTHIWSNTISIHPFLWVGVCENTPNLVGKAHKHMHTCMQGGEVRCETISDSLPLSLGANRENMQVQPRQVEACDGKNNLGVKAGPVQGEGEWLVGPVCHGKHYVGRVKLVLRNFQEKSQKHESGLTYLQRAEEIN